MNIAISIKMYKLIKSEYEKGLHSQEGGTAIEEGFREIRNSDNRLLCMANDSTGEVETQGPHHSSYIFYIPVGGTFTVVRDDLRSLVTRTATAFTVEDYALAA